MRTLEQDVLTQLHELHFDAEPGLTLVTGVCDEEEIADEFALKLEMNESVLDNERTRQVFVKLCADAFMRALARAQVHTSLHLVPSEVTIVHQGNTTTCVCKLLKY